tara:strand:- start:3260 stop:4216 length:957 start_codon:yes stop_codon:yes gene_type:complete
MGYGIGGYISLSKQTAFGTATTNRVFIPFVSESLTENIEQLTIENLRTVYDSPNNLEGINNTTGDIVFEPHPTYIGHFFNACIGDASTTFSGSKAIHEFLPRQTEFAENCTLRPYTIEIFKNVGSAYQITDSLIHTLAVEIAAGSIIRCTATVHGRAYNKVAKQTPSYIDADPFTWNETSLQIGGSANGDVESATITIENPIEGIPTLNGSKNEGKLLRSDFRNITISGDQDFSNQEQEGIFRAQTRQRFLFSITGDSIGGGNNNFISIDAPQLNYNSFAYPIGGPGRITAAYEGKAEYDASSSYALRVTLQNTHTAY